MNFVAMELESLLRLGDQDTRDSWRLLGGRLPGQSTVIHRFDKLSGRYYAECSHSARVSTQEFGKLEDMAQVDICRDCIRSYLERQRDTDDTASVLDSRMRLGDEDTHRRWRIEADVDLVHWFPLATRPVDVDLFDPLFSSCTHAPLKEASSYTEYSQHHPHQGALVYCDSCVLLFVAFGHRFGE